MPGPRKTEPAERRLAQAARIQVPGFELAWFVNTHFHSGDPQNRRPNFDALQQKLVGTLAGPVVLMGDFNARAPKPDGEGAETAYGRSILHTADGLAFVDALEAVGKLDPETFPHPTQNFRLDWIFVPPAHFDVERAFVTGWELSDHEAVLATLRARAVANRPALGLLGVSGGR